MTALLNSRGDAHCVGILHDQQWHGRIVLNGDMVEATSVAHTSLHDEGHPRGKQHLLLAVARVLLDVHSNLGLDAEDGAYPTPSWSREHLRRLGIHRARCPCPPAELLANLPTGGEAQHNVKESKKLTR